MKTIYKSAVLSIIGMSFITLSNAQNPAKVDSTLTRQIMLEKDFSPTLQDASKINTLPAMHTPVVKQANLNYETNRPAIEFNQYKITDTGSGDIKTEIDYNKKKGYLNFGAGTHANIYGALGFKLVDKATDQFDIFARYTGFSGDVDFVDDDYELKDAKAKYSHLLVNAKYQHNFEFLSWRLLAGYENTGFNYYGNPYYHTPNFGYDFNANKKQSVGNFNVETGIQSTDNNMFIYDAAVKLNFFTTKYGPSFEDDGAGGNIVEGKFDMAAPFGGDKLVGINMSVLNQSFGDIDFLEKEGLDKDDFFHSLTKLSFNPYISFDGSNYLIKLGLKTDYAIDKKNKTVIAPDVKADWMFAERTKLYAGVTGGINENTYLQILQENRYAAPSHRVAFSRTPYDFTIGVKSGIIKGLEFDVFGGYKQTKDEHLYVADYSPYAWRNVSRADYYDLSTGHFGGLIKTSLIPYVDLSAKIISFFYDVDGHKTDEYGDPRIFEAWNRPKMTFDFSADITPIDELTLSVNYHLATGRKGLYQSLDYTDKVHKMKNVNELNIRGDYRIVDWISLNASLNNVLNQKYEIYPGYTLQGFGFMAGISMKF